MVLVAQHHAHAAVEDRRRVARVDLVERLKQKGIEVRAQSKALLAEEAPEAYKNVSDVALTCERAGLSKRVVRLRPIAVIKG